MEEEKLYGPIENGRLLEIEVYENNNLLYEGMVESAPDEIKGKMYKNVELIGNKAIYKV